MNKRVCELEAIDVNGKPGNNEITVADRAQKANKDPAKKPNLSKSITDKEITKETVPIRIGYLYLSGSNGRHIVINKNRIGQYFIIFRTHQNYQTKLY